MIRLDSVRLDGWPDLERRFGAAYRAVTFDTAGAAQDHPFGFWTRIAGDSILVGHPAAYAGMTIRVDAGESPHRGTITAFTDVRGPDAREPARTSTGVALTPASCPSTEVRTPGGLQPMSRPQSTRASASSSSTRSAPSSRSHLAGELYTYDPEAMWMGDGAG